jgi:hypothetical protein
MGLLQAKRVLKIKGWRAALLAFGVAAIVAGFILWLSTLALHTTTTANQNTKTTVIDKAGHKSTTEVRKNTTTTTPGVGRSDTMLVALFTAGVGLLVVASLWDRIQGFTIGGVSITLTEAKVETPEIALVHASAPYVDSLESTTSGLIVEDVAEDGRRRLACVDLQTGGLWAPTNLKLYVLLLAGRSSVEAVVFKGQEDGKPERYFGAASIAWLADRVRAEDPELFAAYRATETMPLPPPKGAAHAMGLTFWHKLPLERQQPETDRVDLLRLYEFAGQALIVDRVEVNGEQNLSKTQQRAILEFPLNYVPITDRDGRLHDIIDKRRLASIIAHSAV